jgi:putative MATE family efflux protein
MLKRFSFLRSNPDFYPTLFKISTPIILQGFISTALSFVDVLMVGQLGSKSVASVGLGNQFSMIFIMLVNGIGSGAAIFAAQFWGRRYVKNIRNTFGIGMRYSISIGLLFTIITFFFAPKILSFYSSDSDVQLMGGHYLQLVGLSYVFFSITVMYAAILRSTRLVMIPLVAGIVAISFNTMLNYCLILGHFGFPAMGVTGAGVSMIVARIIECVIIISVVKYRRIPTLIDLRTLFLNKIEGQKRYLKVALPVIIHSMGWVCGVTIYMRLYASISTTSVAAVNISETLEKMGFMFFVGIGNACAIMVGNSIGAGREDLARDYSKKFIFLGMTGAMLMGLFIISIRSYIVGLYNLDADGIHTVSLLMLFMASVMWMKSANVIFNGGILRGGGDTRFSMMIDICGVWFVGIPMGCLAVYYFHFPVYFVVLFVYTEELAKMLVGFYRFRSNKWLKNLVHTN